jgi:hypothetical protein
MSFEATPHSGHNNEGWWGHHRSKAPAIMGDDDGGPHRPIQIVTTTSFGNAGKAFEGCFSIADLTLGISILIDPTIATGSILKVTRDTIGVYGMVIFLILLGLSGATSLILTHVAPRMLWDRMRVLCNVSRCILWYSYAQSMALTVYSTGHLSPMVLYSFAMVVAGIFMVYLAARDVRP